MKKKCTDEKILHIGDDIDADERAANDKGIDTYSILSAVDMLRISKVSFLEGKEETLGDRLKLGLFVAKAFNNPFCLYGTKGRINIRSGKELGYLVMGPIMADYMEWLVNVIDNKKFKYILFISRDGFLFKKMYDIYIQKNKDKKYAKGIYFYTSRSVNIAATADNDESIEYGFSLPFDGSIKEKLGQRFRLKSTELELIENELSDKDKSPIIERYKNAIIKNAKQMKKRYKKYIEQQEIDIQAKIAILDFVSTGTCQMCLEEILETKLYGVYFMRLQDEYFKKRKLRIDSMIAADSNIGKSILEYYLWLEICIKDSRPSVVDFNDDGQVVFKERALDEKRVTMLHEIQQGIIEYYVEYLNFIEKESTGDSEISNSILRLLDKSYTNISTDVISSFIIYDEFNNRKMDVANLI